jgi:hypothetical protein
MADAVIDAAALAEIGPHALTAIELAVAAGFVDGAGVVDHGRFLAGPAALWSDAGVGRKRRRGEAELEDAVAAALPALGCETVEGRAEAVMHPRILLPADLPVAAEWLRLGDLSRDWIGKAAAPGGTGRGPAGRERAVRTTRGRAAAAALDASADEEAGLGHAAAEMFAVSGDVSGGALGSWPPGMDGDDVDDGASTHGGGAGAGGARRPRRQMETRRRGKAAGGRGGGAAGAAPASKSRARPAYTGSTTRSKPPLPTAGVDIKTTAAIEDGCGAPLPLPGSLHPDSALIFCSYEELFAKIDGFASGTGVPFRCYDRLPCGLWTHPHLFVGEFMVVSPELPGFFLHW